MMELKINDLFDKERFPPYIYCISIVFYFLLGCSLAIVRFFIGVQAFLLCVLLSRWTKIKCFLLRIMCMVLGFIVRIESFENYDSQVKIIISNHVTNFDHLAVSLCLPVAVPSVWDLPPYLNWILGYTNFGASDGRQVFMRNVRNFLKGSNLPMLIFPEGATSNNKRGLLKFNPWPFLLDRDVQPITLTVNRPLLARISPSILGSRWWSDFFWFLFVPYTTFTVRFLPVVHRADFETADDFTKYVQKMICKDLKLAETNFTSSDKVEYAKSLLEIR